MYGYTAANFSGRMPCNTIADAIVGHARGLTEIAASQIAQKFGKNTIYGDTDSVFVDLDMTLSRRNISDAIEYARNMASEITCLFPKPVDLKFEKVYWPCLLETKKRYCGYPWEDAETKPEFEAKGIETVRRDGTRATAKILKNVAMTLFDMAIVGELDFGTLKFLLLEELRKIKSNPQFYLYDMVLEKSFRGIEGYAQQSRIPAVKIARARLQHDEKSVSAAGSRVKYFVAANDPESDSVYSKVAQIEDVLYGKRHLDIDYYIEVSFLNSISRKVPHFFSIY